VTLIDFGIALRLDAPRLTPEDAVPGTRSHLSPEVIEYLSQPDRRSAGRFSYRPPAEMHAIGYMLYEALTGRSPFEEFGILRQVPKLPSRVNPLVPAELDAIAMKLLEKKPERRFQTAWELAQAIEAIVARPEGWWDAPFNVPAPRTSEGRFARENGGASERRWRSIALLAMAACAALGLAFGGRARPSRGPEARSTCMAVDGGVVPVVQGMLAVVITGPVASEQLLPPCRKPSVEIEASCWLESKFPSTAIVDRAWCERARYVISTDDCVKNRRIFLPAKKDTMPSSSEPKGK